ncbi:MAG: RTX toxin, partial [Hyphomicrobiales bacterium]|nr:RTX toxin [Hyphomicrobiales bacterium]
DDWSIDGLLYGMAPILGTDGDDTLSGANSDDIFDGGAGNDTIAGSFGHDTYLFGVGSGHDFVDEQSSSDAYDVLKLIGLNQSDVTFTRPMTSTNDLVVMINATGETITFGDQFNNKDGIEKIVFADGSVLGADDFSFDGIMADLAPITGTAGGDNITGTNADELFDGAAGNDILAGGYGHDTYLFGVGSGHDIIDEHSSSSAFDVLKLVGLNQSDVEFKRPWTDVNDIVVTIKATGETMTLDNQLNLKDGVEKIIFDDGTVLGADDWSLDAELRPLGPVTGSGGNDTISGSSSSEPLLGLGGDDTQSGGGGDDTFIFAANFGNDTITDFAAGASTDDVIEFRSAAGFASYADVLANTVDNGTDTTITLDANNSIVLSNVLVSDLSADDFRFT